MSGAGSTSIDRERLLRGGGRYNALMTKTIDTLTITATGLSDTERLALEREMAAFAQARLDEAAERDAATMQGIAEFERGEYIGIEEWGRKIDARIERVSKKQGL